MASVSEDIELGEIALILLVIVVAGYYLYQWINNNAGSSPEDNSSLLNKTNAAIFGSSSLGYTEALDQTLSSPIATLKSIFGID